MSAFWFARIGDISRRMQTFTIYPKDGGDEFDVELETFSINGGRIVINGYDGKESARGYLSPDTIAAILPQQNLDAISVGVENVESLPALRLRSANFLTVSTSLVFSTFATIVLWWKTRPRGRKEPT